MVLVPTVLKNKFGYTSVVSIQNVDTVSADLQVEIIPVTGTAIPIPITDLPSGAARYFDMGNLVTVPDGFTGSMRVTAVKHGTSTPGAIVGTSLEAGYPTSNLAYAFEAATQFSDTVYMPSAFCKKYSDVSTSTYAVQNTGTSPIDITVTFTSSETGVVTSEQYLAVGNGQKVSMPGCGKNGNLNPAQWIGSAKITATGPIAAIGKISNNTGLLTAFLGFNDGSNKIAVPFVRWTVAQWTAGTRSRTNLAIQNIGSADLPAGAVVVKYYDKNGALVGAPIPLGAIQQNGKANSNPSTVNAEFGYYSDGTFGGSAVVEGPVGSKLAVIARVSTNTGGVSIVGEDYNGTPIQ
jgi:hypothetical protein